MMFKMNQLAVGLFLFLSSLFSCQQKGDFEWNLQFEYVRGAFEISVFERRIFLS